MRSRINWYENGEKNSKYFSNLEKTRCGKTAVPRLYDSTGKITVNPRSTINELRDCYQTLYSNHDSEEGEEFASDFLGPVHTKTIVNANASKRKLFCAFRPSVHMKTMKTLTVNA